MARVLIVAHYAAVRAGLHALLCEADDMTVLAEVSGSAEMERVLPATHPDVVLFDANPEDSIHLLALLSGGEIGLVMLGDENSDWTRLADNALPGWALLRKEADSQEIAAAVRAVDAGLIVLDHSLERLILHQPAPLYTQGEPLPNAPDDTLSAREREVLQLMTLGLPNKQIAARLSISLSTVKFHVAAILVKLGASSRTEAVTLGIRRGDVSL